MEYAEAWRLCGVNKCKKIDQSGCRVLQGLSPISGGSLYVIKPRGHGGIIFLQPVLVWETEMVAVTSKCDVCNLSVSGI